jgi:hypothetical protein
MCLDLRLSLYRRQTRSTMLEAAVPIENFGLFLIFRGVR